MALTAADISFNSSPLLIREREFKSLGDQKYSIAYQPAGIVFEVDRLRRERHELHGELSVRVNGNFPTAKTTDGVVNIGDFNFSSVQARTARAKILGDRSGNTAPDWYGLLEEFCTRVIRAEREGSPGVILADIEPANEDTEAWLVSGFPVLQHLPMVVYADSGVGKSMFAMWLAGQIAKLLEPEGRSVVYADWELEPGEHRKRFGRLFPAMPRNLVYARCERSLKHEVERINGLLKFHKAAFAVCDSISFALDGDAIGHQPAMEYFQAVRKIPVGSLHLAHIPKQKDGDSDPQIYGSTFFKAGGRSVWFMDRVRANVKHELRTGLFHKKTSIGAELKPLGFKFKFFPDQTIVETFPVENEEELVASLPWADRIKRAIQNSPKSIKELAIELATNQDMIRRTVSRQGKQFIRVGDRVALKAFQEDEDLGSTPTKELF